MDQVKHEEVVKKLAEFTYEQSKEFQKEYLPTFDEYLRLACQELALKMRRILDKKDHDLELAKFCIVAQSILQERFVQVITLIGGVSGHWNDDVKDFAIRGYAKQIETMLRENIESGLTVAKVMKATGVDFKKVADELVGRMD